MAVIKVKPDKKAEIRPAGNSYIERLALKKAEEESYYELWHKQFQDEVKKKVRAEPEKQPVSINIYALVLKLCISDERLLRRDC